MQIAHPASRGVDPEHAHRGLAVFAMVGRGTRVGQVEAIELDEHDMAALGLYPGVRLEMVEHGKFAQRESIQALDVAHVELAEREVVTLIVQFHEGTHHGLRSQAAAVQQGDPEVQAAVRQWPRPIGRVQGMEREQGLDGCIRCAGQRRRDGRHHSPPRTSRTSAGHAAGSMP